MSPASRPLALALLALCLAGPATAAEGGAGTDPERNGSDTWETDADDQTHLETLEFPGVRMREAVRLHFQSRFLPDAGIGDGHANLYRPELRGRLTLPISRRAVLRVSALGGLGRYDFSGSDVFFNDSLDVYETRLAMQGAYLLNDAGFHLWRDDERWSLIAGLTGGSDFESGAFSDGLWGGGGMGLGFELPGRLQLAAGFTVETTARGGFGLGPTGYLRWNIDRRFTLRSRGLGLQLEYQWTPRFEVFATGFRSTDRYALAPSLCPLGVCTGGPAPLDDLVLQDRTFLTGVGFEWKVWKRVRLNSEIGAVAWRRLRVRSEDLGTIVSRHGDPSLYLEIRFEVRP